MSEWIPVSERLPEDNDDVLVYDNCDYFVAWYSHRLCTWVSDSESFDKHTTIIAWMPIEPYKASPTGAEKEE